MERPTLDQTYMNMAIQLAKRSSCENKKVGCLIVTDVGLIIPGYNGTPSGWDNTCEDEHGNTKDCVSHAEANAISKLGRSTVSGLDATVYCTLSPCHPCSKQLADCGIKRFVFLNTYKNTEGIHHLTERGIKVEKYETF